jgi:hypothetical protein
MREKLNENPMMQAAVVGVLLLVVGIFLMTSMGGGEEAETETSAPLEGPSAESAAEPSASLSTALAMVNQASAGSARPLPAPVLAAWNADKTVVLLFVHDGGIDDKLVASATRQLTALPEAAVFIVPAHQISRYAPITEGVGVNRVPALVVVRPKSLHQTTPSASVSYGFLSGETIVQAVIDAGYKGPTLSYHP